MKLFNLQLGARGHEDGDDDTSIGLEAIAEHYQERHPDFDFTILPDGDLLTPQAQAEAHPRVIAALKAEIIAVAGRCRHNVMAASVYEASVQAAVVKGVTPQAAADADHLNRQMTEVLQTAMQLGASDTYIDVHPNKTLISYRVHGIKQPSDGHFTREQGFAICRALWAKAGSAFQERHACDCKFDYEDMAFRGSSLPTHNDGVGVVLRMRDPEFRLPLDVCGYTEPQIDAIKAVCQSPGGLILLTGETNSGKSSTMATIMDMLPKTVKAIEVSDPVEVTMEHITQVEIPQYAEDSEKRFTKILAGLVRQNPDVLLLGEIRDGETAEAAMQMALQGKRVVSTLHTQSCILAFARLEDLGVDRKLIFQAGFIAGVVNQNLVPLICKECKVARPPGKRVPEDMWRRHHEMFNGNERYASGKSCGAGNCRMGVVGQTLVAEVFPMCYDRDGEVIEMLSHNQAKAALGRICDDWGMERKHNHAWRKVHDGICDPAHVESIIGRFTPNTDRPADL